MRSSYGLPHSKAAPARGISLLLMRGTGAHIGKGRARLSECTLMAVSVAASTVQAAHCAFRRDSPEPAGAPADGQFSGLARRSWASPRYRCEAASATVVEALEHTSGHRGAGSPSLLLHG